MIGDISLADNIYIICGLCSGFFYPHLLKGTGDYVTQLIKL